jgi:hypothetical protein
MRGHPRIQTRLQHLSGSRDWPKTFCGFALPEDRFTGILSRQIYLAEGYPFRLGKIHLQGIHSDGRREDH